MLFGSPQEQGALPYTEADLRRINRVYARGHRQGWFNNMSLRDQIKLVLTTIFGSGAVTQQGIHAVYNYMTSDSTTPDQPAKRLRTEDGSLSISPDNKQVNPTAKRKLVMSKDTDNVEMARAGDGGTQTRGGSEETAIIYSTPSYQLQETHTVVLPVTFYCSGVLQGNEALDIVLRANSYVAPLQTLLSPFPALTTGNIGQRLAKGLYNKKFKIPVNATTNTGADASATGGGFAYLKGDKGSFTRFPVNGLSFPHTLTAATQPSVFQRDWYEKMYGYYTVLGFDYEVMLAQCQNNAAFNFDITAARTIDVYSSTNVGNQVGLGSRMTDVQYWKHVNFDTIRATRGDSAMESVYKVLSGNYKPGQGQRMVSNDEDVKTWTKVGQDPSLMEDVHLMFWPHAMNTMDGTTWVGFDDDGVTASTLTGRTIVNFQVNLKYLVQFKDLNINYRYPLQSNPATINLTLADYDVNNQTPL